MRISKEALKILSKKLPAGSASKIHQSLINKDMPYSLGYIYRVLDPDYSDYNSDIIDEALKIAENNPVVDPKELEAKILKLAQS